MLDARSKGRRLVSQSTNEQEDESFSDFSMFVCFCSICVFSESKDVFLPWETIYSTKFTT